MVSFSSVRDRDGHVGDVANLGGEVRRHRVDALGQLLPDAGHLDHLRLAAELAFGADFAGDTRHLGGEHAELLDHRVDDRRRLQELAPQRTTVDVETHGLQEVALRDGGNRAGHLGRRPNEVVDEGIDGIFHLAPRAARDRKLDALAGLAVPPDHLAHPLKLICHALVRGHDLVEGI